MSKLEEIREAVDYFEESGIFHPTEQESKRLQTLIDLARLILEEKELPQRKEYNSKYLMQTTVRREVDIYNQAMDEVRPIVARLRLELKEAKTCEFCGSTDLVCGKAWKEERDKLQDELQKLWGENENVDSLLAGKDQEINVWKQEVDRLQSENEKLSHSNTARRVELQQEEIQQLQSENSALKEKVAGAKKLLESFVDDEPCSYDHHGYCQTHAQCTDKCLNAEAKQFLEGV